ncbi:hypothetical protein DL98DRAFT_519608 [Cadophora sp. DSE1049]|nr:hypothetical protein DL98DRAFT_519608 [Cadophora sp. DSE1049]
MKTITTFTLVAALAGVALAQDPGPSPTNSFGCEPHGDHWHCDGPITASATIPSSVSATAPPAGTVVTSSPVEDHNHEEHEDEEHDHSSGTGSLAPSPTESIGCEPHGDHWHCEGPVAATTGSGTAATSVTIAPSPTESVGCEPHGDHWHCDGPAVTSSSGSLTSVAANATSPATTAEPSQTFVPSKGAVLQTTSISVFASMLILAVAFAF